MGRRPAIAAVALAGVLLAVMGAASGGTGGVQRDLTVKSVLGSVLLTIVAVVLLVSLVDLVLALARRHRGEEPSGANSASLLARLGALLAVAVLFGVVIGLSILLAHRGKPHHPNLLAGGAGPTRQVRAGKALPINTAASSITAFLLLAGGALFYFRRRIYALLHKRPGFTPLPPPVAGTSPAPAAPTPFPELPDPAAIGDPRLAVLAAYERFAALMGRRGRPRLPEETVFEYESRIALGGGPARRAAAELSDLFATARYSEAAVDEEARGRALNDLSEIERHLVAQP